jgi:hypothetical protein
VLKLLQSAISDQRFLAVLQACLGQLIGAVLYAIADTAPAHLVPKLADVLQVRSICARSYVFIALCKILRMVMPGEQCLLGGPSPKELLAPTAVSHAAQQAVVTALGAASFPSRRRPGEESSEHRQRFLQLLMPLVHTGRRFRYASRHASTFNPHIIVKHED